MNELERNLAKVVYHLDNDHLFQAGKEVRDLHPADIAHIIDSLPDEQKRDLFTVLPAKVAAEVVVDLSDYARDEVLEGFSPSVLPISWTTCPRTKLPTL